jgi:hypothetical protein
MHVFVWLLAALTPAEREVLLAHERAHAGSSPDCPRSMPPVTCTP